MLDMLCSFPSPCGNEEVLKRYIMKKYPADWYEDSIGNLIFHKNGTKEKVMLYVSIDEDGFLVMEKTDKQVFFAHLGNKKIFPGTNITFGGYKGVVCSSDENSDNSQQYIKLIADYDIKQGYNGVADFEYYEDEGIAYTKEAANRISLNAILELIDIETEYDLYFVLGVQSNKGYKGAITAVNSIKPDIILAFEQTTLNEISYKVTANGFMINPAAKEVVEELSGKVDFSVLPEINKECKSSAAYLKSPITVVFGIPVEFSEDLRQTVKIEYKDKIKMIIKNIL